MARDAFPGPGRGGDEEPLVFGQHELADALGPGPVLGALALAAAESAAGLSDNELLGVASAARRLQAHAEWMELQAVAEFTRRRAEQYASSKARGDKPGKRDGEYPDTELAQEFVITDYAAGRRMDLADQLSRRLRCTFAGMKDGVITGNKAAMIVDFTRFLSDEQAAEADKILAAAAPALSPAQLRDKAARLEMRLDPEGVRRRREDAARRERRVEARREDSGNAYLAGRELDTAGVIAADAAIKATAVALRNAGMEGSLRELRTIVFLDRLRGRNPHDRLTPACPASPPGDQPPPGPASPPGDQPPPGPAPPPGGQPPSFGQSLPRDENCDEDDEWDEDDDNCEDDEGRPGGRPASAPRPGSPAPLPALINLIVPAGTMFGWSDAPAEAGAWGLLDAAETRDMVQAASRHPRTRWCVTVVDGSGQAVAHGCARGAYPWTPETPHSPGNRGGPGPPVPDPGGRFAQLAELLRRLNPAFAPVARGGCDHARREDRYIPSRSLKHLVRARTTRCCAPSCNAQAINCEIDHTLAYPAGDTDQCNLAPGCPRHHHAKHAPGWVLEQPRPGLMRWTTPSGRSYQTTVTSYDC